MAIYLLCEEQMLSDKDHNYMMDSETGEIWADPKERAQLMKTASYVFLIFQDHITHCNNIYDPGDTQSSYPVYDWPADYVKLVCKACDWTVASLTAEHDRKGHTRMVGGKDVQVRATRVMKPQDQPQYIELRYRSYFQTLPQGYDTAALALDPAYED